MGLQRYSKYSWKQIVEFITYAHVKTTYPPD